jgi:exodeoxyribonuclease V alpha subunit
MLLNTMLSKMKPPNTISPPLTTLEGHLETITYYNEETHFSIAKFRTEKNQNLVTILGYLPEPKPGEALKIHGVWETHAKYGQQLKLASFEVILPATVAGIRTYLESGLIKGIGPKMAARFVRRFKDKTLEVIETNPEKLLEIKGIGKETAARISRAWEEHHAARALMRFLRENGIKTSYSAKILKTYGYKALDILRNDPYRLVNDIPRIGFYIADAIVQNSEMPVDEFQRAQACVMHLMEAYSEDGNIFIHEKSLIERCQNLFRLEAETILKAVQALSDSNQLVIETVGDAPDIRCFYLKSLHQTELGISTRLKALLSNPVRERELDSEKITVEVLNKLAIKLSSAQIEVLEGVFSHRVAIITGGPGTGKTTLIRSITAVFEALGKKILLAAPTGRAARRLTEVTRRKASTIHKLLGFNLTEQRFEMNRDNTLDADTIIIDEASMVDTFLMYHLINAVHLGARLVLVGDVFQLPSVGPGNVLSDLIKSQKIKTFELKKIFRQTGQSPIVVNAHKVRRGDIPDLDKAGDPDGLSEFYFIEQSHPETVAKTIVELCRVRIPERFALDPINEIQVLTPMHKGLVGTHNLNQVLQQGLNTHPIAIKIMGSSFRLGDKVMHLKNNYQKEVFNGDIGTICDVDNKGEMLAVNYDGRIVSYDFSEIDEISLAYAISVHKSQGSEYPAVILPLLTQHFAMLQRNLLYTAITRGKKLVILIGTQKALAIALKNDRPRQRLSSLAKRLITS